MGMHGPTLAHPCPKTKCDAEGIWELSPKRGVTGAGGHTTK